MGFNFGNSDNSENGMNNNFNNGNDKHYFNGNDSDNYSNQTGRTILRTEIQDDGFRNQGFGNSRNRHNGYSHNNRGYNDGYSYMKICPKCGEQVPVKTKICYKCGTKLNTVNSFVVILLLLFFFPIGLYLMWARTNWNKTVKIVISAIIGFFIVVGIIGSFTNEETPTSSAGIQSITVVEDEVRLDLSDELYNKKTVMVTYLSDYSSDILKSDFKVVVDNSDIANAEISLMAPYGGQFDVDVTGLSAGTTKMHIESSDGTIKSEEIIIEVVGEAASDAVND